MLIADNLALLKMSAISEIETYSPVFSVAILNL